MCRKFVLVSNLEKIESRFGVKLRQNTKVIAPSYCISPGDSSYVITSESPNELQVFKFSTLKRAFKKLIQSEQCLVIADAYYEWSSDKKPYLVYLQNKQRPFAFEGIYQRCHDYKTGVVTYSYSIITTKANSLLQSIGVKSMPVILPIGFEKQMITSTNQLPEIREILKQFDPDKMNAYPVSDLVNTPGENNIQMITPIGEKLQIDQVPSIKARSRYYGNKVKHPATGTWGENRK